MPHDPEFTPPLDANPAPLRKSLAPRSQGHRAIPPRKAKEAAESFQNAHSTLFGTPSGKTTWSVRVSDDPDDWFYRAEQSTERNQGPPTIAQILGKDKGDPTLQNFVTLTNLQVEACISSHWSKAFPIQGWEEAVLHAGQRRLIVLGAEPIEPPAPADAAWRIRAIYHINDDRKYCGRPITRFCLALGSHTTLTERADQTDALIEHLKKVSQQRLQGNSKSGAQIVIGHVPAFGAVSLGPAGKIIVTPSA